MPLFEYSCRACRFEFERLVRRGEKSADGCPRCGSHEIERLPSLFAVDSLHTRQAALASGRRERVGEQREQAVAQIEAIHNHRD